MNEDMAKGFAQNGAGRAEALAGEALGDIKMQLRGKADEVAGKARKVYGQAKDDAAERIDQLNGFVKHQPYAAIGIAAFMGFILGHLISSGGSKVIYLRQPRQRI
jgi:uncharacterized protein YjbJ (UPF0337 family)